jgi:hypothetical protein
LVSGIQVFLEFKFLTIFSSGLLAEILLPVAFMALLIGIKGITSKYNSPTIAYYCGQTFPWFYSDGVGVNNPTDVQPFQCLLKPANCTVTNYYQKSFDFGGTTGYSQLGYEQTPNGEGRAQYPFYAFTIADESKLYQRFGDNPSLPYCEILNRIENSHSILAVAPGSDSLTVPAQNLMHYLSSSCNTSTADTIKYFDSESALNDFMKDKDYDDTALNTEGKIAFAIVLNKADIPTAQWDYAIRVNWTADWNQDDPTVACLYHDCSFTFNIPATYSYNSFELYRPQLTQFTYGYSYSGFLTLQNTVDKYIFSLYNGLPAQQKQETDVKGSIAFMPTQKFESDDFQYVISSVLGIFYMLSFLYPVSRLIRGLVIEKEFRIKEGMKMMGLTDTIYNCSWLITTLTEFTIISILITLVTATTVFQYSDKILVFIYFEAFAFAIVNMCFLLATLFSKSKTASLLGPMIFFATFFPYYAVQGPEYDRSSKVATCLLAPSCFALGADVFASYEGDLVGVIPSNAGDETTNFNYNIAVGMMFADAVIYGILAWYLDKVIPSEFGTSLPFYFPLSPNYWCGIQLSSVDHSGNHDESYYSRFMSLFFNRGTGGGDYRRVVIPKRDQNDIESASGQQKYFEKVSPDLQQQVSEEKCLHIVNLRKVFRFAGQPEKVAVKGLNLDMFQNQVTVLLGKTIYSRILYLLIVSFLLLL